MKATPKQVEVRKLIYNQTSTDKTITQGKKL